MPERSNATEAVIKSMVAQQRNSNILIFIFIIAVSWSIGSRFFSVEQSRIEELKVTEVRILGSNILCPGDPLKSIVHLYARGTGTLVRDVSIQSAADNRILVAEENIDYPFSNLIDQDIRLSWVIPRYYLNIETGVVEPFPSGEFLRNVSFTAIGNDSMMFDMASLRFTVPETCFDEESIVP